MRTIPRRRWAGASERPAGRPGQWLAALLTLLLALAAALPQGTLAATSRYVAPTGADNGDCSATPCKTIGYALEQAGSSDTVVGAAGLYRERLTLSKGMTLQGAGAGATVIDGDDGGTVVTIDSGVTATIAGMTLQRGNAAAGGGVANYGTLTLTNSAICKLRDRSGRW